MTPAQIAELIAIADRGLAADSNDEEHDALVELRDRLDELLNQAEVLDRASGTEAQRA